MVFKVYIIFAPLEWKGIYYTWEDCKGALDRCRGQGHSFSSFKKLTDAQEALRCGTLRSYKEKKAKTKAWLDPALPADCRVQLPCLVVDAACSGYPGPVEYRGVVLPEEYEAFRCGPYVSGTNNIGEYLAIVTGLRWLEQNTLSFPLYSDSRCAIGWVKGHGNCNSHLETIGPELTDLVARAERWVHSSPNSRKLTQRVRKWETVRWGEVPADYGNKRG